MVIKHAKNIFCTISLNVLLSPGAMLLLWAEAFQAGNTTYSLQLHPVSGTVGWAGLQFWPQQSQFLSVCRAVYQDPAGRGQEQKEEGEAVLILCTTNILKLWPLFLISSAL